MKEPEHTKITRQSRILDEVERHTQQQVELGSFTGIQANEIAERLALDRSNVCKELNRLYRKGQVIKQQGKPTLYIHKDILCRRYPGCFIPVTIPNGSSIEDYVHGEQIPNDVIPQPQTELENMIGSNGSMKLAIQQAKAAVSYPPRGLHTLIIGSVGVGKSKFAREMYLYAQSKGKIWPNAEFITFNCQDYSASPQYLISQLFGFIKGAVSGSEKGKKGLIESAAGGILYLDGVDKLPPKAQDMLITLIEKNIYFRLGEASVTRQADLMIIAATTEPSNSPNIERLVRSIPVQITLPDIDDRGAAEILQHLFLFFDKEAESIGVTIIIHKDILSCLAAVRHIGNIGEMKSTVKIICSQAYLEFSSESRHSRVMEITYRHLPPEIAGAFLDQSRSYVEIVELFSQSSQEYVVFTPGVKTPFFHVEEVEQELSKDVFTDKDIRSDISFEVDDVENYISHCVNCLQSGSDAQINALKETVPPNVCDTLFRYLAGCPEYLCVVQNSSLFYGLLLHVFNVIKCIQNHFEIQYHPSESVRITNPKEYTAAEDLRRNIHRVTGIMLPDRELSFMAMYLSLASRWPQASRVALIAVFHGDHVAESMAEYVNSVCGCNRVSWINFTPQTSYEALLQCVVQRAQELNQGAGVLLLTDMEPLTALHKHITSTTGIKAETVSGVSLPVMLAIAHRSLKEGYPISKLLNKELPVHEAGASGESPLNGEGTSFINRIINEILTKSLTFLNPTKAAYALLAALDHILNDLQLPYSDEIAIKFIFHCSHMLERVIRVEPLEFDKLKRFVDENSKIMLLLEKRLSYISEIFGVNIPTCELAYVAEIFLPYLVGTDSI